MSRVLRTTAGRAVLGLALGLPLAGLTICSIAKAGDLAPPPPYPPAPYGVAPYLPDREGPCHVVFERRLDPYGRETVHRMRLCDEGPAYPAPGVALPPPDEGYPPPPYFAPSPSEYAPRPPAPIGGDYYN